ncbi:MAG: dihydropteroate synthase [Elusimicrobia bacterium]|nr:dihydropteroate synthase [Elusimicrobiota bacterium]
MNFKEIIKNRIVIFDGATGTQLASLKPLPCDFGEYEGLNEWLNFTRPDLVSLVHEKYLQAGADVIETNTFGANSITLSEYGLRDKVFEINKKAAEIAKSCAVKFSTPQKPRFAAGSMGPTTVSAFVNRNIDFDSIYLCYKEQAEGLIAGGVDILLLETAHDILNLKAGLKAVFDILEDKKIDLPVIASVTMDKNDLMLSGHNTESAYWALEHFPLTAFGFNCSTGPEDMAVRIKTLSSLSRFPLFIMPNAGLPDENGIYKQTPDFFSSHILSYAGQGLINIAGGCCGTGPEHIRALAEKISKLEPREIKKADKWAVSHLSVFYFDEIEPPMLIGERNNSIGSKKFRDMISSGLWREAADLGKKQAAQGAHALDICLANPDRNEIEDLSVFLPILCSSVKIPLMIDTTNLAAAELACKISAGKIMINSVNFEFGEKKPLEALALNRKYGAKIVFGLIDEDKAKGMAVDCERKIAIAERAYDFMINKGGMKPSDLIFDALVFPVGVGGDYKFSASETIKAVGELKKIFPEVKTILGISNVSFGLPPKAREVLNSVFLREAVLKGLDSAIVNIEKLVRYSSISKKEIELCENLIYAKNDKASFELADYFRGKKEEKKIEEDISSSEKIYRFVLNGTQSGLEEAVKEEMTKSPPMEIINGPILKAMAEVGRLFSKGDLIVTEVLACAESVKKAVSVLEPELKKSKTPKRGKVLLATVKGDVHDIGKNLAKVIFEANGFEIEDLGVKVPSELIVEKALSIKPDFIGLSGLLVRSTEQMALTAKELALNKIKSPLLLGGAALSEKYVLDNIIPVYEGPVIYAKDAMDGLNKALAYLSNNYSYKAVKNEGETNIKQNLPSSKNPNILFYPDDVPVPKDFERKIFEDFDLEILFDNIDWPMFNFKFLKAGPKNEKNLENAQKILQELKKEIILKKLIRANGIYRFFPANSKDNSLIIFDEKSEILSEIFFPRQNKGDFLAIPDFILPISKGKKDFIAFTAANCGEGLKEKTENMRKEGNYVKAYLLEALGLMLAESMTEILHRFVREDWGISQKGPLKNLPRSQYRGKRYSFGYPPCPDLSNQAKLFSLINPQDIGLTLTENFMMDPEAGVSSFILHNPKAVYFSL